MFRIDHPTAVGSLPTPSAAGTPGWFTEGNPGTGTPATVVTADWANMVQDELLNVLVAAGIGTSKTTRTQVRDSLYALFPGMAAANRSAASPGYIKLPGGLILQWVRNINGIADGSGNRILTFTYPVAFTDTVYGYSYVADDEASFPTAPRVLCWAPTLTQQPITIQGAVAGSSVAVSGFIIGK